MSVDPNEYDIDELRAIAGVEDDADEPAVDADAVDDTGDGATQSEPTASDATAPSPESGTQETGQETAASDPAATGPSPDEWVAVPDDGGTDSPSGDDSGAPTDPDPAAGDDAGGADQSVDPRETGDVETDPDAANESDGARTPFTVDLASTEASESHADGTLDDGASEPAPAARTDTAEESAVEAPGERETGAEWALDRATGGPSMASQRPGWDATTGTGPSDGADAVDTPGATTRETGPDVSRTATVEELDVDDYVVDDTGDGATDGEANATATEGEPTDDESTEWAAVPESDEDSLEGAREIDFGFGDDDEENEESEGQSLSAKVADALYTDDE